MDLLIDQLADELDPDGRPLDRLQVPPGSFNDVYRPYLHNMARTQIFFGGSSSGKSVFAVGQRPVIDVLNNGRNYLIVRQVAKDNRRSTFVEVKSAIDRWGLNGRFQVKDQAMTITADTGYQIIFAGLDDVEKTKSIRPLKGAITDVVIEEATQTDQAAVKQLMKRQRGGAADTPKRLTLLFNPILQSHWIYTEYFAPVGWTDDQTSHDDQRLSILKTWYVHNKFLTPDDIYDLENEPDQYFKDVYTFGRWGVLGDVIFTNWEAADLAEHHNQFTSRRAGLDFGYGAAPAAGLLAHYDADRKTIYIFAELYEKGLTNDLLATAVHAMIGSDRVVCDSAEPKSIAELRQHGVDAVGARKGQDSVRHGIQWLKQQRIIVDKRCVNMINELQQYHWKKDRHGAATGQPVDMLNHLIDALRYAFEDDMKNVERGARRYK